MIILAKVNCFIIILTWGVFFFSYLKYKNKLIIDIFVTGILSGLVSITGDSKMFMIFYLFIFYERIGLFQNTMILFVGPPKFCIVFQLHLGLTTAPIRWIENSWLMQNFGKTTKSIMVFWKRPILLFYLNVICIGNSMICSDIWHKYHEW